MVLDASGSVGSLLELRDHAAKKGHGRRIPLHPDLQNALTTVLKSSDAFGAVVKSERGGPMTPLSHRA